MNRLLRLSAFAVVICMPPALWSQAVPTARRTVQFSAFGLLQGTYTGLAEGRNLGVTLGGDLSLYHLGGVIFSGEVRGTYPLDKGNVDGQKSALGGIRIEDRFSRLVVFGDVLAGRGGIDYQNGGYVVPPLVYFSSNSTVYDGGGGLEFDISRSLALKADVQVQRWNLPFTSAIYPKQIGIGVVYRFGANGRPLLGVRD